MKVPTIISTIFIPLTFIVGLYGMNFTDVHPVTGRSCRSNMPELRHAVRLRYGVAGHGRDRDPATHFLYRKGWLSKE